MATALDVFCKSNPLTITQEELDRFGSGKPLDDVIRCNQANDLKKDEASWRQELFELSRRFPMPSVEEAESRLANLQTAIKRREGEAADKINARRTSIKTPYLSPLERTHLDQGIALIEGQLADFKASVRVALAQAKDLVEQCKTWAPHRERWQELKKRAASIDKALQV